MPGLVAAARVAAIALELGLGTVPVEAVRDEELQPLGAYAVEISPEVVLVAREVLQQGQVPQLVDGRLTGHPVVLDVEALQSHHPRQVGEVPRDLIPGQVGPAQEARLSQGGREVPPYKVVAHVEVSEVAYLSDVDGEGTAELIAAHVHGEEVLDVGESQGDGTGEGIVSQLERHELREAAEFGEEGQRSLEVILAQEDDLALIEVVDSDGNRAV
mmetsp:Transcript_32664/g.97544  ORF Transcript_32664/g.97544 Transcript_32664/m.97544 type:complete len:215 (+) Transcript_32664:246-890(+)